MDELKWRLRAKTVACVGLFLSIVSVLCGFLLTFGAVKILDVSNSNYSALYLAILFILVGIHSWTALKLLSATEKGKVADEALKKSHVWLTVNMFLVIPEIDIIISMSFTNYGADEAIVLIIAHIIGYGIYFIMMFIVFKFIEELEKIANSGGSSANKRTFAYCLLSAIFIEMKDHCSEIEISI